MANENEQIKNDETNDEPKAHKESWLEREMEHADKEFPLSGAETNDELIFWESATPEEKEARKKALNEELNSKFPLSGGETEEDL